MAINVISDLRKLFGPARDQGARPTCMAFAASDAHAGARPGWTELCAEWAYFHGLKRDGGAFGEGVTLSGLLKALEVDGQPPEVAWPYSLTPPIQLTPPTGAAPIFRRLSELCSATTAEVRQRIDAGQPVLLTMSLSDAFYNVEDPDGVVSSTESPDTSRRHAVVAVGHGQREKTDLILIRNSWGKHWGVDGHAWLDTSYLAPRLYGAAVLTQEPQVVPSHP